MIEYLAGYKTSYADTGKAHACDPATGERRQYSSGNEYTSRCGQKHLDCNGQRFGHIIKFDQCQRCVQILEHEATTQETDGLAVAIATLTDWKDSLPDNHQDRASCHPGYRSGPGILAPGGMPARASRSPNL